MTNPNRHLSFGASSSTATVHWIAAGLLISMGVMFQLGELGYGPLSRGNLWLIFMIAESGRRMLAVLDGSAFEQLLQFWPLLPLGCGLAILFARRRGNRVRNSLGTATRTGDRHGE